MGSNRERITWLTFIGWLVLALVIAMFAAPIALWVGAAGQPTVIRIAVAIFCACIVQRLLLLVRHAAAIDEVPQADHDTRPSIGSITTDPLLTDMAKDLRWGGWYFVPPALWTRLQRLRTRGEIAESLRAATHVPLHVMPGEGSASMACSADQGKDVDTGPSPNMTTLNTRATFEAVAHQRTLSDNSGAVLPPELMPRSGRRPTWAEAERVVRFLEDGR